MARADKRSRIRRIALTAPERLLYSQQCDLEAIEQLDAPSTIIPLSSVLRPEKPPAERLAEIRKAHPRASRMKVLVAGRKPVSCAAIAGVWYNAARTLARDVDADFAWHTGSKEPRFLTPDATVEPTVSQVETIVAAACIGRPEILDRLHSPVGEPELDESRWHASPLGASCTCGKPLQLIDHWSASSATARFPGLVICSEHGEINISAGLRELVQRRHELDGALLFQPATGLELNVYVVDVLNLESAVYVGMTSKTVEERLLEHGTPGHERQANVFKGRKGGAIGSTRTDRPELPALHSLEAALAAEAWVAQCYRVRGDVNVHGGH